MPHNLSRLIAEEETRLTGLKAECAISELRLAELRQTLAASQPKQIASPDQLSSDDKIALFRSLFRGRDDVFPLLWESKTGRKGYTPACANEWESSLCRKNAKPPVRCNECTYRSLLPVTDDVIRKHLLGRHTVGVYALLSDDTCWFLAADFDKQSWREDVAAFRETCHRRKIPVAVERSRSGNGAHIWFFFSQPVAAADARALGNMLITETMSRYHQLSMESYDRLFPSQDVMPSGGFGNLIALPLQSLPRQQGNAVFIDDSFTPYPDQWAFLKQVQRIDPATLNRIIEEGRTTGSILGASLDDVSFVPSTKPWERPAFVQELAEIRKIGVPAHVAVVQAQRLFVEKNGLSSQLLNRIKRLAVFSNPEYHRKQRLRFSTALTPRFICCAEDSSEYLAIPRGCQSALVDLLQTVGAKPAFADKRVDGNETAFSFNGILTPAQKSAVDGLIRHELGILSAPPGTGKTVIAAWMIAARKRSTLVLVHRKPLMDQWVERLSHFLDILPKTIGRIGAGRAKITGQLDIAMIQSFAKHEKLGELLDSYGQIIVDECHHLPAVSFEGVMQAAQSRYVLGLTATPRRRDGHHPILFMQSGPVRLAMTDTESDISRLLLLRRTGFVFESPLDKPPIQSIYAAIASDGVRNRMIVDDVLAALQQGKAPLLLTERKDHLHILKVLLEPYVTNLIVLSGGMKAKEQKGSMAKLAALAPEEPRLVLAIGRYIGEGFDDSRLDTLFLAMPFSWRGTLVQYTGRLHREHDGKQETRVYDYVDELVPMLARMAEKRRAGMRGLGYRER